MRSLHPSRYEFLLRGLGTVLSRCWDGGDLKHVERRPSSTVKLNRGPGPLGFSARSLFFDV